VHLLAQSALLNTTNFFESKKSLLMAPSMQVARHSHALTGNFSRGAQILGKKEELPFT
jgi:hypothetical protein